MPKKKLVCRRIKGFKTKAKALKFAERLRERSMNSIRTTRKSRKAGGGWQVISCPK